MGSPVEEKPKIAQMNVQMGRKNSSTMNNFFPVSFTQKRNHISLTYLYSKMKIHALNIKIIYVHEVYSTKYTERKKKRIFTLVVICIKDALIV